ncbi:MAG: zinc-binding dehydrogenase [Proteobacteria bacterium]|nr:zinc-binding dehydrogenase [Pseudomonadota bacterium]
MKAWLSYGFNDMRLEEVPMPHAEPGWVVCKVRNAELSVTEIAEFRGLPVPSHDNIKRMLAERAPMQLWGHEFCGEVVEVGAGVTNVKLGDRVFYHRGVPCGTCKYCAAGMSHLCRSVINVSEDTPGCLAEYFPIPASTIAAIPSEITDKEACGMQPLVSVMGRIEGVGIAMGDTVVVIGQGPMGLFCTQIAAVAGAAKVVAIARRDPVLALSKQLGATHTINATKTDVVEAVMEITKGLGCDVVLECAGGSKEQGHAGVDTFIQGLAMLRNEGRISEFGHLPVGSTVPIGPIDKKGLHVIGTRSPSPRIINYAIDLVASKRVQIEPTVTHVLQGIEKVPEAIEITGNKAKYGAIGPAQVVLV